MKIINQNNGTKVITDKVTLGSCYLNPTFEFDAQHGSVNLSIRIKKEDFEGSALETAIDEALVEALETARKNNPKVKGQINLIPKAIPEVDDNGEETGYILLKCKNRARVEHNGELKDRNMTVVDSGGRDVENYKLLTAGTVARVSFTMVQWYMSSRKETSVSFWLNGLQVLAPVFYEGNVDFESDKEEEDDWKAPAKTIEDYQKKSETDDILDALEAVR